MTSKSSKKVSRYISPYIAAVLLGSVLFGSFFITGQGLGASGGLTSIVVAIEKKIAPNHVNNNEYLAKIGGKDINPLNDWLVFQVIGIFLGAMVSGALAGRLKAETNRGERISDRQRWMFALFGGILFGFGAKFARGCTSGFLLTGGASLALGAWVAVPVLFGVAYLTAFFVKKLWI